MIAAAGASATSAVAGGHGDLAPGRERARRDVPGVREAAEDVSRLKHLLVAAAVLALGRRRTAKPRRPVRRIVPAGARRPPRGEPAARSARAGDGVRRRVHRRLRPRSPRHQTQWARADARPAFALVKLACSIVIARRLVVTEEQSEAITPRRSNPEEQQAIEEIVEGERLALHPAEAREAGRRGCVGTSASRL